VVILPLLVLVFDVDIHYAMGASLVSMIAISSGAAAAYVKKGYSNVRVGMFLEIATMFGALFEAFMVAKVSTPAIGIIFGVVLLLGFSLMFVAGALSGRLGIGSGAFKVLAMDHAMSIPFKVSTTTSNFMIGVTAAASAGIYLRRGYVEPGLAMPVMLGVLAGSLVGVRVMVTAETIWLRRIFGMVIVASALEMIYGAATGKL